MTGLLARRSLATDTSFLRLAGTTAAALAEFHRRYPRADTVSARVPLANDRLTVATSSPRRMRGA